jgi:hypothetical protein
MFLGLIEISVKIFSNLRQTFPEIRANLLFDVWNFLHALNVEVLLKSARNRGICWLTQPQNFS